MSHSTSGLYIGSSGFCQSYLSLKQKIQIEKMRSIYSSVTFSPETFSHVRKTASSNFQPSVPTLAKLVARINVAVKDTEETGRLLMDYR